MKPIQIMEEIMLELENMSDKRPWIANTERLFQWEQAVNDHQIETMNICNTLPEKMRAKFMHTAHRTMKKYLKRLNRELARPNIIR